MQDQHGPDFHSGTQQSFHLRMQEPRFWGEGHEQSPASTFTMFLSVRSTKLHDWFAPGDRSSGELLLSLGATAEVRTGLGVRGWQRLSLSQQTLLRTGEGVKQQA